MRKFIILIILLSIFLTFYSLCYAAEEKKELKHHPPPEQYQKSPPKPILPPVVPSSASAVSPTPSPHIAAPSIVPSAIDTTPQPTSTYSPPTIQSVPSMPAHAPMPTVPVQVSIPQVPIIGNVIGEVLDKGSEEDGVLWIEVEDQLFNQAVKIKVKNLQNTPIVRQAVSIRYEDIKIGNTINVIFINDRDENVANFISILTGEEIEMMKAAESGQLVTSEEPNQGETKPTTE